MQPVLASLLVLFLSAAPAVAAGRPMTIDDLPAVKSVADPQVSPDGKLVAYVVSEIDREANKTNSSLWAVPLDGGGQKSQSDHCYCGAVLGAN
jgi:hypothetical protein